MICPNNTYDDPPYLPIIARPYGGIARISDKTLCMRARQNEAPHEYKHYDVHNLYGWSQSEPTLRYFFIIELNNKKTEFCNDKSLLKNHMFRRIHSFKNRYYSDYSINSSFEVQSIKMG